MSVCELKIPSAEGLQEQELTVGRTFELSCSSLQLPDGFQGEKAQFVLDEKSEYAIKSLQVLEVTPTTLRMKAVSYKVGDWNLSELKLTDSVNTISLGSLQYSVKSIMPQDQSIVEPYGPMGPLSISIPWFYIAFALAVVLTILTRTILYFRRRWQKQTLLQRSQADFLTGTALHQFHFYCRQWQRKYAFFNEESADQHQLKACLDEIDFQFKIYLVRSYQIPALDWSSRLIIKDLKKRHKEVYQAQGLALQKILNETNKAKAAVSSLQAKDVIQILDHCRRWAEKADLIEHKKSSAQKGGA